MSAKSAPTKVSGYKEPVSARPNEGHLRLAWQYLLFISFDAVLEPKVRNGCRQIDGLEFCCKSWCQAIGRWKLLGMPCGRGKLTCAWNQIWSVSPGFEDILEDREFSSCSICLVEMRRCLWEWGDGFYPLRFEIIWTINEWGGRINSRSFSRIRKDV